MMARTPLQVGKKYGINSYKTRQKTTLQDGIITPPSGQEPKPPLQVGKKTPLPLILL